MSKMLVVGAGHVGTSFLYAAMIRGLAGEIYLSDLDEKRAEGEVMDLAHAVPFLAPAKVVAGSIADAAGSDVVVITAGAKQRPGETRLDLASRNVSAMRQISSELAQHCPGAIVVVASNPVDVATMAVTRFGGFEPRRVIGSGTVLDSARLRHFLAEKTGVDARNVHAYVLGEHGDSQFVAWSAASIGSIPYGRFCEQIGALDTVEERERIALNVRGAAYAIIERKGATHFAIGMGLVRIVEAVLQNQGRMLTVSTLHDGTNGLEGMALSLPAVVDRSGVRRVLALDLAPGEQAALEASAAIIRRTAMTAGM